MSTHSSSGEYELSGTEIAIGGERPTCCQNGPASCICSYSSVTSGQPLAQNNWRAIVGPANISPEAAKVLNVALGKVIDSPDWKAFCKKTYTCTKSRSPAEITLFVEQTYDDVGKFIDKFGLRKK